MFSKTSAASKKKIRVVNETPTKLHTASIHLRTQEDLTLDWSRPPLKELLQLRRQQDFHNQTSLKKLLKIDCTGVLATTRVKESSRSAKKISVQDVTASGPVVSSRCSGLLATDRKDYKEPKELQKPLSKRMRTEVDNMFDDSNIKSETNYLKLAQQYEDENRKLKQDLKKKKQCIEIKAEDLVVLLSQFTKLKAKNEMLQKQLQFYRNQISNQSSSHLNSVFKVLSANH